MQSGVNVIELTYDYEVCVMHARLFTHASGQSGIIGIIGNSFRVPYTANEQISEPHDFALAY